MDPTLGDPAGENTPTTESVWPYIGVGCLTMVVGFFGGGMIAMLVGRVTDAVTACQPPEGLPVCSWWRYWWTGAAVGMVALPAVAVSRLRKARKTVADSNGSR